MRRLSKYNGIATHFFSSREGLFSLFWLGIIAGVVFRDFRDSR
jgi:hypothetical protein